MARKKRKRNGIHRVNVSGKISMGGGSSAWNEMNKLTREQYGINNEMWKLDRAAAENERRREFGKQKKAIEAERAKVGAEWKSKQDEHVDEKEKDELNFKRTQLKMRKEHIESTLPRLQEFAQKEATLRYSVPPFPSI